MSNVMDTLIQTRRTGRPPKNKTNQDKKKQQLVDEILYSLEYSSGLTKEQVKELQDRLDATLQKYEIEREEEKEKSTLELNMEQLENFLASKRVEGKSQTTIYNYGNEISKMFLNINKSYKEITADDIRKYMDYRKTHDKLAQTSVQNIRMYLMSFYKYLMVEEKIVKNPMDKIGTIKVEKRVVQTLSDEEAEMIRCACKNERDLAIIDILSGSGMRVSELVRLDKDDVNFETGEMKVFGKGSKERVCYLTGRAKVHLKWYLESRVDNNPALFVTSKKPYNRMTKNGIEYTLREIAASSKIPTTRLYPHKYRSTFATNMINKGADVAMVQNLMGHQSCDTTTRCYTRISTDTARTEHHKYVS